MNDVDVWCATRTSSEVSNLKISKLELIVVLSVLSAVSFTSAAAISARLWTRAGGY
jgi:hypothetical protein